MIFYKEELETIGLLVGKDLTDLLEVVAKIPLSSKTQQKQAMSLQILPLVRIFCRLKLLVYLAQGYERGSLARKSVFVLGSEAQSS